MVQWQRDRSCTRGMSYNKIHIINTGCPRPSIALQALHRGLKHQSYHFFNFNIQMFCIARMFSVLGGPENVTITPVKPSYMVGDVLSCSASANPPVSKYTWYRVRKRIYLDIIGRENQVTIPARWQKLTVSVRCKVESQVLSNQTKSNTTQITIYVSKYNSCSHRSCQLDVRQSSSVVSETLKSFMVS